MSGAAVDPIADRALGVARGVRGAEGADVLVQVRRGASANVRFAKNALTTSGSFEDTTVSLWIALGKRHAWATSNQVDDKSLRALAERGVAMAKLAPEDPERMPVLGAQRYAAAPPVWDAAAAAMSAEARAAVAALAVAEGDRANVEIAGFFRRDATEHALRTSGGLAARHDETEASYTVTARTPDGTGSGWAGLEMHSLAGFDAPALTRVAIDKAIRAARPRTVDPGKYTVVLEPACVAEMLAFLVGEMDQRSADEGRSFFTGKLGERAFADFVSLTSDPTDPATPGAPFDNEGLPLRRQPWIDAGRVAALQVSRFWAAKKGLAPTGAHRVHRLSGGAAESIDALVQGTKRGLLVTRFWYTRMLEPQTLTLTGLTRDGVFLIEDGRIAAPVTNFRYNESPAFVLKNVEAMTRATVRVPSDSGIWHVPALRTREFTMASGSAAV
jgi:predicted Zn-dependent protease